MNPKSSGETDKSVPAEMIDQLTPDSGAPNCGKYFTKIIKKRDYVKVGNSSLKLRLNWQKDNPAKILKGSVA